jgi:hypothetical protein
MFCTDDGAGGVRLAGFTQRRLVFERIVLKPKADSNEHTAGRDKS